MTYTKEQSEQKANNWFLGIPQNGDLLYRLTREEIIKTIVGFALSFEQKEAQPPTSQENECDTCEYQGKFTVLDLTIKKKWFDMIASGEKKEEYREMKPYWDARLIEDGYYFRHFDLVKFRNGYKKDSPYIILDCLEIQEGHGNPNWGAEVGKMYYIIKLGSIYKPINQ